MKNYHNDSEEDFLLTFSDILRILKKNRHRILIGSLAFAFFAFLYGVTRPIEYQAYATFKEKGKSQLGLSQSLSALLLNAEVNDSDALMMMKSRKLVEQLVKSLGLQVVLSKKEFTFSVLPLQTIKQNLLIEYALLKKPNIPVIKDQNIDLYAKDVTYHGEIPFELQITFQSDDDFEIFNHNGNKLGEGSLGAPFFIEGIQATLMRENSPGSSYRGIRQNYLLTFLPLGGTAQTISKRFFIESDRSDKNLLKITYKHGNRHQAVSHINALMDLYQEHIIKEHQRTCALQIEYLQNRQQEMDMQLQEIMKNHAQELSSNLNSTGFVDYGTAMNFLTNNQHQFKQKLQALDLEIQWLHQAQNEGKLSYDTFNSTINSEVNNLLSKEIRSLRHEADSLEIALRKSQSNLQVPEDILIAKHSSFSEFQGIDLQTAKELYLNYSKELNDLESKSAQQQFIINQINDPEFEISSLSTVLVDPISTEMISKATQLIISLKDHENLTQKEQERLKAGLSMHKEFFIIHLSQAVQLMDLRQRLMKEKIEALQRVNLSLIQEQISLLENQMTEQISRRLASLKLEKALYDQNLAELRTEMATLPRKWVSEQLIKQQMEINQNMIEEISKLVESKNLTSNLEKIQSAPVDLPITPIHPQSPHLFLITFLGTVAGAFLSFSWVLVKSVTQGVEASAENLCLAKQHVSGKLTKEYASVSNVPMLDSDLNTLRRLIAFITSNDLKKTNTSQACQGELLLLLINKGPNYSMNLAELMFKMGLKILVINLSFDAQGKYSNESGLLQYLEGSVKQPVIINTKSYDFMPAGGISRHGNELIASNSFRDLIENLRKQYDWIIASSTVSPQAAEAEHLLELFPYAAISVMGESLQQLRNCISHAHGSEKHFITFVVIA